MNRELKGGWAQAMRFTAIAFTLFQLYTAGFGFLPDMQQRAVHVAFGFVLTFALISPTKRDKPDTKIPVFDLILIGIVIVACANAFIKYRAFLLEFGQITTEDMVLGTCLLILTIEAGRRTTGWAFPMLTILLFVYALAGPYFPGMLGHGGFKPIFIIRNIYQSWQGIWGTVTGISATLIALFIIFGAFILESGVGKTFIDIANKIAGGVRGGPALVAVVASGLFGMISGSAAANVAGTGNFTIPLMKRLGYNPAFAGAVEAVASTGGQLAPPVMGAGAFIMAEFLGISYLQVCIAAAIPAFLFYVSVFSMVRLEALRLNLIPIPKNEILPARQVFAFRKLATVVIPLVFLFTAMGKGYSATYAAFLACVSLLIVYLFSDFSLPNMKHRLGRIVVALESGGKALIQIVALCVCASVVIALINQTGLGVKLSEFVMKAAGVNLYLSLIFAAIIALILGMGVPTAAAYILCVTVTGPILIKLGLIPICAHLFVFYYAIISAITPPVCIAAYTASAIAQANWLEIAFIAMRLGIVTYFVPFLFVHSYTFLMIGSTVDIILNTVTAILGIIMLSASLTGYLLNKLNIFVRIIFLPAAVLFILPGVTLMFSALGLLIIGLVYQWFKGKSKIAELNIAK